MTLTLFSDPVAAVDEALVAQAAAFAADTIAPAAELWEQQRRQPADQLREAIRLFGGLRVPQALGGLGASAATTALVYETLAGADIGFTFGLVVHNNLVHTVATGPNVGLRDRYLPDLMTGRRIGAFLLTEPTVGSDATQLQLQADSAGTQITLNGAKTWAVNGVSADLLLVFAQTVPGSRTRGIAAYLMEADQPGIERLPIFELLGGHAMGSNGFRFVDCQVEAGALAFPAGSGFRAAMQGIDFARFSVAAMCNGALKAGLARAVAYANERHAFDQPIIQHQGLQFQLADVLTELEASRLLTFRTAARMDQGQPATLMAAHAKKYATRAAFTGLSTAMQAMGANGLRREHGLARQLDSVKVCHYTDGTTEIQNVVIGRSLLV